jgi:hypothetical protein
MRNRRPEKVVQAEIVKLLEMIGAKVYKLGTTRQRGDFQGTMQTPGISDLYVFLPDRRGVGPADETRRTALWIEVKAEGGKLRPEQAEFRDFCKNAAHAHIVGGLDDVILFLERGGWLHTTDRSGVKSETQGVGRAAASPNPHSLGGE